MDTYFVVSTLNHNGTVFQRGALVGLSKEYAAPLLAAGVISEDEIQAPAPVATEEKALETPAKPSELAKVGGETATLGDEAPKAADGAKDVTPVLVEMKRADLNALAVAEGLELAVVEAAKNKDDVIALIEQNRKEKEANGATVPPAPTAPKAADGATAAAADNL